jgi:N-glycosylase/DNA lyase
MQGRFIKIPESIRAELLNLYAKVEGIIQSRLIEFKSFDRNDTNKLFAEMSFCVLTPQSRARAADAAVNELATSGLLFSGSYDRVAQVLKKWGVRFYEVKASHIIQNRYLLRDDGEYLKNMLRTSPFECRELLVENVWGFGYKEASHFLRNIGFTGLAILDRHILRNMLYMGVIEEIPKSLTRKRYLDLEEIFIATAQTLGMSPESLDLLLWYRATGEVFK